MDTTKVHIDLDKGIIELEGTEAFVSKYLDEFKANLYHHEKIPIRMFQRIKL
jgi:hypothetical protein